MSFLIYQPFKCNSCKKLFFLYIPKQRWARLLKKSPRIIKEAKHMDEEDEDRGKIDYLKNFICKETYKEPAEFIDDWEGDKFKCPYCGENAELQFWIFVHMHYALKVKQYNRELGKIQLDVDLTEQEIFEALEPYSDIPREELERRREERADRKLKNLKRHSKNKDCFTKEQFLKILNELERLTKMVNKWKKEEKEKG